MHQLGLTRSVSCREYLLHTTDAYVRTPLPGLAGGTAIVHAAPQLGARFAMTTLELEPDGRCTAGPVQRFVYVLEGELELEEQSTDKPHHLSPGGYAYLPTGYPHTITARTRARMVLFEKPFNPITSASSSGAGPTPGFLLGYENDAAPMPLNGDEGVQVRGLLPASLTYDFAVNTMTYAPGASLDQVEVHWMEHGLLMLSGGGVYRLDKDWHPVQAGDAIWMAPFCPQWFAAVGKTPAKYLIYKDFNRHVLG
jgi:(S)-ureidoglycine aminohydrolase